MKKFLIVVLLSLPAVALAQHFKPAPRPAPYRPAPSRPYSPPRYTPPRPAPPYRAPQPPPTYFQRPRPTPPAYYPPPRHRDSAPAVVVVPSGGNPPPTTPSAPINWRAVGLWVGGTIIVGGIAAWAWVFFLSPYLTRRREQAHRPPVEQEFADYVEKARPSNPIFQQKTFTCSQCKGVFPVKQTLQEARDEAAVLFEGSVDENEILCDECFKPYQDDARRG